MAADNKLIRSRAVNGDKQSTLKDIGNLMVAKRLANLGMYGVLVATSVYAVEQATEAKPVLAYVKLAVADTLFVFGSTAVSKKLSDKAEDRIEIYSQIKTGRVLKKAHIEVLDEIDKCDALELPGKQRVGAKALIGALAGPTAIASHNLAIKLFAGVVTAVCAWEVGLDGIATQILIGGEHQSMVDQVHSLS